MQTINLNTRKYELISQVMQIEKEQNVRLIEDFFSKLFYKSINKQKYEDDIFKPMRENISIEEMLKEQNYKGFDRNNFNNLVKELNIQEPIEDLLNELTA